MMKHIVLGAVLALLGSAVSSASAEAKASPPSPADCILAHIPYSSKTPVFDLMLNPRARDAVDRALGGKLSSAPERLVSTQTPSFATIITPVDLMRRMGIRDDHAVVEKLDADLASIPVSDADAGARCARYDRIPPQLPATIKRPAVLVFDKIAGFRDGPSVTAATEALKAMAERRGWSMIFSDKAAVFNARDLARFDAVIWNNVSGDVLTVPQQKAFKAYLAKGGGYAGIHGAGGDYFYPWDWYADTLLGARFIGHPIDPHLQKARLVVDDKASGITRGLEESWSMTEEWYSFKQSPRTTGAHILVTLDEGTYQPAGLGGTSLAMGDHPIAWTRCIGNGRAFYTAIGHSPAVYSEPNSVTLLENGISWAMGSGETLCHVGQETLRRQGLPSGQKRPGQ